MMQLARSSYVDKIAWESALYVYRVRGLAGVRHCA